MEKMNKIKGKGGILHSYSDEEKEAFASMLNIALKDDEDLKDEIPISEDNDSLFENVGNGILLW